MSEILFFLTRLHTEKEGNAFDFSLFPDKMETGGWVLINVIPKFFLLFPYFMLSYTGNAFWNNWISPKNI